MSWLIANLAPIMFLSLVIFLLSGFPVAFSLAACGMVFGFIAIELGVVPVALIQALPPRLLGIMQNETLLAIPFFTLMGLVLERSGIAEDLLETVGQVFGALRGGLAIAVIVVGGMLAATTGVMAATVISMGLISLPVMMRYGYNRPLAAGAITASGALSQIVPPSIVLIVIADQLGRSVGDMYLAAFVPAFILIAVYIVFLVAVAIVRPNWAPALPPEARIYREPNGSSGHLSLFFLLALSVAFASAFGAYYPTLVAWLTGNLDANPPRDETIVMSLTVGVSFALSLALANTFLRLRLLSQLAQRVTFVLIPPVLLIFLVLGTIFLGIATPTEGGAMGAIGALLLAGLRGRLSMAVLKQALNVTTKLSVFVMFVLIGSTVFSLTFQALEGPILIERMFDKVPGEQLGFLLFVNFIIFVLGFFLDIFEIAFILLPLLAPIAVKLDIDLIWFGIIVAMNLQTSFLTPPLGFALFYLRAVAPHADYDDRVTGRRIARFSTSDIYRGSIPFVLMQLAMVGVVIAFPGLVLDALGEKKEVDLEKIRIEIPPPDSQGSQEGEPPLFRPSPEGSRQ